MDLLVFCPFRSGLPNAVRRGCYAVCVEQLYNSPITVRIVSHRRLACQRGILKKLKIIAKYAFFGIKIFFRVSLPPPLAPLRGLDAENHPHPSLRKSASFRLHITTPTRRDSWRRILYIAVLCRRFSHCRVPEQGIREQRLQHCCYDFCPCVGGEGFYGFGRSCS